MVVLKKIGVLSLAKIQALVMAVFGLIFGLLYAIIGSAAMALSGTAGTMGPAMTLGFSGVIVLPIVYGIFGFIGGAIGAFLYNLVAKWIGGLELEFDKKI